MSEHLPSIVDPYKRPLIAADFEAILAYLPEFESPGFAFTEPFAFRPQRDDVLVVNEPCLSPLVMDFIDDLYRHGWIIAFDWTQWDLRPLFDEEPELIASASVDTLRRLLTTHLREDCFCEGHLLEVLESGCINAILRRLRRLYEAGSIPDASPADIDEIAIIRWEGVRSIAREDVEAILHFLPAFEAPDVVFGEIHWEDPDRPGVLLLDGERLSPLAEGFIDALHRHHWIIPFDYLRWDGRHLRQRPDLIAGAQVTTLRALLSMHIAGGRIVTGHLLTTFESGGFTVILRRLQQLYDEGRFR